MVIHWSYKGVPRYNKRYEDTHTKLDWAEQEEAVERFKEEFIFSDIMKTEAEEKSMMNWLGQALPIHTFTPRHFESEEQERQPLGKALRMVGRGQGGSGKGKGGEEVGDCQEGGEGENGENGETPNQS